MNVSILTQPLGHNYGGLLQAYALQQYLHKMDIQVETLDYPMMQNKTWRRLKCFSKNAVKLLRGHICSIPTKKKQDFLNQHLVSFKKQYLTLSPVIHGKKDLYHYYRENEFDAVIVGSDQVWRPKYSPCLKNFYLDFLDELGCEAKRISYAASFGVTEWEYSREETELCRRLVQKFDAVSVREKTAQTLCQEYFDISPELMIDPTLLFGAEKYRELFKTKGGGENEGKVLLYFLDPESTKLQQALSVAKSLKTESFSVKPNIGITDVPYKRIDECVFPPVEEWLQSFDDAAFVLTDSFHGCIFSIIFNKPFIAVGNTKRGISRFESLLKHFGLSERLVYPSDRIDGKLLLQTIDWDAVNHIRQTQVDLAEAFFKKSLGLSA